MPIFKRRAGSGSSRKSSSSAPGGQSSGGIMIVATGLAEPSLPPRIETQLPSADYRESHAVQIGVVKRTDDAFVFPPPLTPSLHARRVSHWLSASDSLHFF